MDTYQALVLNGSTNGLPIQINATTSGTANTIHTCAAISLDEIWLAAFNYSSVDANLILCLGDITTQNRATLTIPAQRGIIPVLAGVRFSGSLVLKAYASLTGSISVIGNCNRIILV